MWGLEKRISVLDFKSLSNFDWRSLQKYLSPQAAEDFNTFLERMPQNVNQVILITAGIAWAVAGAVGLMVTVKVQQLTELRSELEEQVAVQPMVPSVSNKAVSAKDIKEFALNISDIYTDLEIKPSGSQITIQGKSLLNFGQFREAVGHVQNGGSGWRVNVERLCVGKECSRHPLSAALKINRVNVQEPKKQEN